MPWIEDKQVFRAVSFASSMVKKGQKPRVAIHVASKYYNVCTTDIASELGKRGAIKKNHINRINR